MSDERPRLSIRVGQDVFNDVDDYLVLIRTKDKGLNTITSRTSSYCWAHGAMEATLAVIMQHNMDSAEGAEEDGDD